MEVFEMCIMIEYHLYSTVLSSQSIYYVCLVEVLLEIPVFAHEHIIVFAS